MIETLAGIAAWCVGGALVLHVAMRGWDKVSMTRMERRELLLYRLRFHTEEWRRSVAALEREIERRRQEELMWRTRYDAAFERMLDAEPLSYESRTEH